VIIFTLTSNAKQHNKPDSVTSRTSHAELSFCV